MEVEKSLLKSPIPAVSFTGSFRIHSRLRTGNTFQQKVLQFNKDMPFHLGSVERHFREKNIDD